VHEPWSTPTAEPGLGPDLDLDIGADPYEIDTHAPRPERLYNYLVGGGGNFAADRQLAHRLAVHAPTALDALRANALALGAFMSRAVRHLAREAGIRQFLNAGTPVPTVTRVHDVAQQVLPEARVVYTSSDPVVLAHAHTLREGTAEGVAELVHGSLRRNPHQVLDEVAATLDFDEPVAVLLLSYLNFVPDHLDPYGLVRLVLDRVPPGSYLVLAHSTSDVDESVVDGLWAISDYLTQKLGWPWTLRSRTDIARFLDGLELMEPGFVQIDQWQRYDNQPPPYAELLVPIWGGVGRKPGVPGPSQSSN
jgi:hypothetical protein